MKPEHGNSKSTSTVASNLYDANRRILKDLLSSRTSANVSYFAGFVTEPECSLLCERLRDGRDADCFAKKLAARFRGGETGRQGGPA
jgi:hypothetical protein